MFRRGTMDMTITGDTTLSELGGRIKCRYSQTPQYRRSWDWRKSGGIPKTAVLGVIYKL